MNCSVIQNFPILNFKSNVLIERSEPHELKCLLLNSQIEKDSTIKIDKRIKCVIFDDFEFKGDVCVSLSKDDELVVNGNNGKNGFCIVSFQDQFNSTGIWNVKMFNTENCKNYDSSGFYPLLADMFSHKSSNDFKLDIWKYVLKLT